MGDRKQDFESFIESWCDKNLGSFGHDRDEIKHFHAPRAERLRDEAHDAGFGTEITSLGHMSKGGLVGYVKGRYDALELRRTLGDI
jgi:hypothetical protein